jgi:NAD(P)-dependent dehydrogenase (short-subunit alcohol dehydrogenase family)
VAATTRHFGKLDVLVNNAGISGSAEQDFYSTEAWHRIMAVNAVRAERMRIIPMQARRS